MRRALPWSLGLHAAILAAALLVHGRAHVEEAPAPVAIDIEAAVPAAAAPAAAPSASLSGGGSAPSPHHASASRGVAHRAASGADGSPVGSMDVEQRGGGTGAGGDGGGGVGFGGGAGPGLGGSVAAASALVAIPKPPAARVKVSKARPPRLIYPKREGDGGHEFVAMLTIDEDGYVVGVQLQHTGAAREEVAAESVWRFRYQPALDDDGRPIRARLEQHFLLGD